MQSSNLRPLPSEGRAQVLINQLDRPLPSPVAGIVPAFGDCRSTANATMDLARSWASQSGSVGSMPSDVKRLQTAAAAVWAWARHHAASRRRNAVSRQRGEVRTGAGFCSTRWAHSSNSRARARYVSAKRWLVIAAPLFRTDTPRQSNPGSLAREALPICSTICLKFDQSAARPAMSSRMVDKA
jgi:hypothetical protein